MERGGESVKTGPKRQIKVDPETGCHVAQASLSVQGYPIYRHEGKRRSGARVVWMEANGPIPDGLQIDHLCRNRACVNLEHLELVTPAENVRRSPRCKLTLEKAREIRQAEGVADPELAEQYGVSASLICMVQRGHVWREDAALKAESRMPDSPEPSWSAA